MEFKNQAVAITQIKEAKVMDCDMPIMGDCDVLVKVKASALCSQEQRFYLGGRKAAGFPLIAGHESAGEVISIGSKVEKVKVGDHVSINGDRPWQTAEGTFSARNDGFYVGENGSLVKYIVCHDSGVIVCRNKDIPFEELCLTEPLACVTESITKANIKLGDSVVIIGAGIMGILHTKLAKKRGASVIISEPMEERRKKALEMGADYVVDPLSEDPVEFVKKVTFNEGANVVFNTTPIHDAWIQAIDMLAPFGKLICYSSQHPDEPVPVYMGKVHSKQIQIIGTTGGCTIMETATRLIEKRIVDMKDVIDSVYDFKDGADAFKRATTLGTYRVIITD